MTQSSTSPPFLLIASPKEGYEHPVFRKPSHISNFIQNHPDYLKKMIDEEMEHTFEYKTTTNQVIKKTVKNLLFCKAVFMRNMEFKKKNDNDPNSPYVLYIDKARDGKFPDRITGEQLNTFFESCKISEKRPEMERKQTYSFLAQIISHKKGAQGPPKVHLLDDMVSFFYAVVYDKTEQFYRQYSTRLNTNRSLEFFNDKFLEARVGQNWRLQRLANQEHLEQNQGFERANLTKDYIVFVVGQNGYLVFCQTTEDGRTSDPILLTEFQYLFIPKHEKDANGQNIKDDKGQDVMTRIVYRRVFDTQRKGEPKELFLRETQLSDGDGMAVTQAIIQRKTGGDNGGFVVTGIINAVLDMEYMREMMYAPTKKIGDKDLYDPTAKEYYKGGKANFRVKWDVENQRIEKPGDQGQGTSGSQPGTSSQTTPPTPAVPTSKRKKEGSESDPGSEDEKDKKKRKQEDSSDGKKTDEEKKKER